MEKNKHSFTLTFLLALFLQIVICKYLELWPLISFSLMPAMIFALDWRRSSWAGMLLIAISAIAVDILGDGLVGLTVFASVLLLSLRQALGSLFFSSEDMKRGRITFEAVPTINIIAALLIFELVYFIPYVILDGGFIRGGGFCALRILLSVFSSLPLNWFLAKALCAGR